MPYRSGHTVRSASGTVAEGGADGLQGLEPRGAAPRIHSRRGPVILGREWDVLMHFVEAVEAVFYEGPHAVQL